MNTISATGPKKPEKVTPSKRRDGPSGHVHAGEQPETLEELQKRRDELQKLLIEADPKKGAFSEVQRPLVAAIWDFMTTQSKTPGGMTIETFSRISGISKGNIGGILRGTRWAARCEREVIDALAKVLNVPVLQIYILSGFISAEDTIFNVNLDATLDSIYYKMTKDNMVNGRIPGRKEWDELPRSIKLSFCQIYEIAAQKVLLRMATALMPEGVKLVAQAPAK